MASAVRARAAGLLQGGLVDRLNGAVNRLVQYDSVEAAKRLVTRADEGVAGTRAALGAAKQAFEEVSTRRARHQQDINALLHRKPQWSSRELGEFQEMCKLEHEVERDFEAAKASLQRAETAVEASHATYLDALRNHYHQEQVWNEKGRRLSTFGTISLILFNSAVFLASVAVIEPRKREQIVQRVVRETQETSRAETDRAIAACAERLDRLERRLADDGVVLQQAAAPEIATEAGPETSGAADVNSLGLSRRETGLASLACGALAALAFVLASR